MANYISIIYAQLIALGAAIPTEHHIAARQTVQCTLTGWEKLSNSVNYGPNGGTLQSFGSSPGFDLGAEGHDAPLWTCAFGDNEWCNPDAMSGQVIPSGVLGIDQNLEWYPKDDNGCMCSYMGTEYTGTKDGDVFTGVTYNEGTNRCTCEFPCIPRE